MDREPKINFSFWFQWLLLNAVGWAMGMTIRQFLFGISGFATNRIMIGVVIGAVVGVAQLFAYNQAGYRAALWVIGSVIGWAVGWGAGWGLGWDLMSGQGFKGVFGTIGLIGGVISGAVQWLVLRQQVNQAGWWVPVSAVAWAFGLGLGVTVGGPFGWALTGAASGLITGFVLVWLLRRPVTEAPDRANQST